MECGNNWWLSAPLGVVAAGLIWALWRADRNPACAFKLVELVTDRNCRADKYALAYIAALLVGTWLVWFAAVHNRLTEWMLMGYLGAFVVGAGFKTAAATYERVGGQKDGDKL